MTLEWVCKGYVMDDKEKIDNEKFHQQLEEIANTWLKEFNLKNIEDDYIPNIPKEVKNYIGGKDMKITHGNFIKLLLKKRESMIKYIKPTIENPNLVLDNGRGILFIKQFINNQNKINNNKQKTQKDHYFVSISKSYDGEWIFSSHSRRQLEFLQKKIKKSKIIIDKGFERSEVASACDILKSGGEVSMPSHLQIKYTANQDFGTNPNKSVSQNKPKSQGKNQKDDFGMGGI